MDHWLNRLQKAATSSTSSSSSSTAKEKLESKDKEKRNEDLKSSSSSGSGNRVRNVATRNLNEFRRLRVAGNERKNPVSGEKMDNSHGKFQRRPIAQSLNSCTSKTPTAAADGKSLTMKPAETTTKSNIKYTSTSSHQMKNPMQISTTQNKKSESTHKVEPSVQNDQKQ
ncbi:MAG: hypothetical protein MHMPM18_000292 [Marteilia pararefringens]